MGKFWDYVLGKTDENKKYEKWLSLRRKYKKEALEEYESRDLNGWLDERIEMDLNPADNVKKYRADLKRWFLQTKEAYNANPPKLSSEWGGSLMSKSEKSDLFRKFEITDKDFPLIYYIKDSEQMNNDIGYEISFRCCKYYEEEPIAYMLTQCPDPYNYRKSNLTVIKSANKRNFYKKPGRKRR